MILLRNAGGAPQVLMGRRHAGARFLPGYYVFPGGVVDPEDARARPATELAVGAVPEMGVGGRAMRARTIAMAAVRETFEETGLTVCRPGEVGPAAAGTWGEFQRRGVAAALDALQYVGRAITPTNQRYRYHARFFSVWDFPLDDRLQPDGELEDLLWLNVDEALSRKALRITTFMLRYALQHRPGAHQSDAPRPVFTVRRGTPRIRIGERWFGLNDPAIAGRSIESA